MKKLLVALSILTIGLFGLTTPSSAHHGGDNQTWGSVFTVFCDASHTNLDDPITGANGTSHRHQYFGSRVMDFNVTEAEAEAGDSTCRLKKDTAGYWIPALTTTAGATVSPPSGNTYFYYYCVNVSASCVTDAPIPNNLKVIFGTTVGDPLNNVGAGGAFAPVGGWQCANQFYNRLINCSNGLHLNLHAPPCWDGVNLDSANHRSHMTWLVSGACPASHPVKLAMPHYFVNWPNVCVGTNGTPCTTHKLASDGAATPGSTAHADFWNTWDQPTMDRISNDCTISHIDVGESVNDWGCRLLESNAWFAQTGNPDDGLIANASFETGTFSGWTVTPAAQAVVNTASKNTGTYGAQLNAFAGGSVTLKQTFPVTAGETICTSANIFPQSNYAAGQTRTSIQGLTSPYPFVAISPQLAGQNGGGLGPGEFKHVWAQGVVQTGQTSVQVLFSVQPEADGVGTVYFDDLAFFRGPCPLPTQPPPPTTTTPPPTTTTPPPPPPPTVVNLTAGQSELRCPGGLVPVIETTNPLVVSC